ncbi:hypothetical protein BU58_32880 [Escherichia coli O26:H11 str. 2011C-3274]|nr:hypothetical protein BU59_32540 [Escherichia coli O69:H11 str. 07-3763]KDV60230.1 hypothetical protein BU58_32880 [Escherichia coli O26:H11 str. 2011C-3274]
MFVVVPHCCSLLHAVSVRISSMRILKKYEKNYFLLATGSVVTFSCVPASIPNRSIHISSALRLASR